MDRWARSRVALPALSGLILAVAYYLPLLAPNLVAFVPLLYWLERHPDAGAWSRVRAGLVFGLVCHALTLHFLLWLTRFTWLAVLLYVGLLFALAAKISLIFALAGRLRRRTGLSWGLVLPACWIPFEWFQSFGDLRLTHDQVAYSLSGYPFLIQFADLAGGYGVGAVLLAVNGLIHDAWLGGSATRRRRAAAALALVVAAVLGYDTWAWFRPLPDSGTMKVAVVQPDIPLLMKHDPETDLEQEQRLADLTRRAAADHPTLIVWPETARPRTLYHWLDRPETYAAPDLQALAMRSDAWLLSGIDYVRVRTRDDWELYNAAVLVDPRGRLLDRWVAKVDLVPFAEALPFRSLLGPLVEGRGGDWDWVTGGFSPGTPGEVLDLDGTPIGVLVCYEQMFPDLARGLRRAGARLQVVITNDAWFGRTPFQRYQADALRLRAIENRSSFVRAANTGISGFVDPWGRLHEATPLYTEAVIEGEVRLAGPPTVYDRFGDLAAWSMVTLLVGLVGLDLATQRRGIRRG